MTEMKRMSGGITKKRKALWILFVLNPNLDYQKEQI